jgi:hypothetical protein
MREQDEPPKPISLARVLEKEFEKVHKSLPPNYLHHLPLPDRRSKIHRLSEGPGGPLHFRRWNQERNLRTRSGAMVGATAQWSF